MKNSPILLTALALGLALPSFSNAQTAGMTPPGGGQTAGLPPLQTPDSRKKDEKPPVPRIRRGGWATGHEIGPLSPFGAYTYPVALSGISPAIQFHQTQLCQTDNAWQYAYQTMLAEPQPMGSPFGFQNTTAPWLTDFFTENLAIIRIAATSDPGIYPVVESVDQFDMYTTTIRYAIYIPIRRPNNGHHDHDGHRDRARTQPSAPIQQDPRATPAGGAQKPFEYPAAPSPSVQNPNPTTRPSNSERRVNYYPTYYGSPFIVVKVPRNASRTQFVGRYVYYNPYEYYDNGYGYGW